MAAPAPRYRLTLSAPFFNGLLGVQEDINSQKEVQDALRASEERLQLFIAHAPASLAMLDKEMRYIAASRRWQTDYGLGDLNIIGLCHYDVFSEIPERWKAIHRRALSGEVVSSEEDRFVRGNGKIQWLRWQVRPWNGIDGRIGGIVIFSEDISDRKNAELLALENEVRYRHAIEATNDGLWEMDLVSKKVHYSPQWARLLGYEPHEVTPDANFFFKCVHPEDLGLVDRALADHLAGNSPIKQCEIRLKTKSGDYRWFDDRGKVVERDENGRPLRLVGAISDITSRKEVEIAIRTAEVRYRTIFNLAGAGVARIDSATGLFLQVNEKYCEILQMSEAEMLACNFQSITYPEDLDEGLKNMERLRKGEIRSFEMDQRYIRRGGSIVWVNLSVVALWPENEAPSEHIAVVVDITEAKRLSRSVQVERDRLRQILDSQHAYVALLSPDGRIVEPNQPLLEIFGRSRSETLGGLFWDLDFIDPKTKEEIRTLVCGAASGKTLRVELPVLLPGKDLREWDVVFYPLRDAKDAVAQVVVFGVDITERNRAEAILRTHSQVLMSMGEGVSFCNSDGTIKFTNPAFEQMFGYGKGELVGKHVSVLNALPRDEGQKLGERIVKEVLTKGSWQGEIRNLKKDGSTFWTIARITALQEPGEVAFVTVQEDITETKRLQKELLEVGERESRRLGHELHDSVAQELVGMCYRLDRLADGLSGVEADRAEDARDIRANLNNSVKAIRRIVRGMSPIRVDGKELLGLLEDLCSRVRQQWKLNYDVVISADLPRIEPVVASQLYFIAQEASFNAARHGNCQNVVVRLVPRGDTILLEIEDDGIGIRPSGDAGIGLHVMKHRAEAIGAHLEILANKSGGTCVRCVLPIGEENARAHSLPGQ